ncbi:MAG TPA: serine hydroxymethyltransferase [Candidatus Saccharimonadia bacterium]|nr:serine hydroxymethyltransferase [Candidatus Saccharimonadia bacterium]
MNKLTELTTAEYTKQRDTLNLIASENYPSQKVLDLLGSVWSNKYAEGTPGKRYYAGNVYADEMETFVQQKALEVFDTTGEYSVNAQVLSGSPANTMVYMAMLEAGDTIMSLNLANGGHLSHLHATSNFLKFFKHVNYDVTETTPGTYDIDEADYQVKLAEHKPKLVILGFSAYPRKYEFAKLTTWAHAAGALVLADIAHINGLVAAGLHDTPFRAGDEGADFVSMTTHKTFRGPRSAMLFAKTDHIAAINKTIFPGTSGGPHLHAIAAVGQALLEILGEDQHPDGRSFKDYSQAVLDTCKALENGAKEGGLTVVSPTQNHLCLVKLPDDVDSLEFQRLLERVGIITNRNMLPFDTKSAWRPSGMRFGTAALASRGLTVEQAGDLGRLIASLALGKTTEDAAHEQTVSLAKQLAWWYNEPTRSSKV